MKESTISAKNRSVTVIPKAGGTVTIICTGDAYAMLAEPIFRTAPQAIKESIYMSILLHNGLCAENQPYFTPQISFVVPADTAAIISTVPTSATNWYSRISKAGYSIGTVLEFPIYCYAIAQELVTNNIVSINNVWKIMTMERKEFQKWLKAYGKERIYYSSFPFKDFDYEKFFVSLNLKDAQPTQDTAFFNSRRCLFPTIGNEDFQLPNNGISRKAIPFITKQRSF